MRSAALVGLVALLLVGGDARAEGDRVRELLGRWLAHSPEVSAWRAQIGAARFDVVTARLLPNPALAINLDGNVAGTSPDAAWGVAVELSEELPIFGQRRLRRIAAERALAATEASVLSTLWDRAADILDAILERAFAEARVRRARRKLDELTRLAGIVEKRVAAGAASTYDALRVETSMATVSAGLRTAETVRTQAEAALLALVADPSLKEAPLRPEDLRPIDAAVDERALVERALEVRPDLEQARRGQAAALARASSARRDAVPTPRLSVGTYVVSGPFGTQLRGGLSLPLPLFDRNQGQVGRALVEARGEADRARALEVRITEEVRGAVRSRDKARAALAEFRARGLAAATELVRRAEVTYQAGKFSIVELIDAYQAVWDARDEELALERQAAEADARLARAAVLLPLPTLTPLAPRASR
jgi:cobalt-zinc-cadmium efflux system outer membrane protein